MSFLDFIFPKNCLECGKSGKYICGDCLKKVSESGWWGRNYSIFKYEGVIRKAIIALKYKYSIAIADELSSIIIDRFKINDLRIKNITLVPIPLYKKRFNERGFNQSEILGREIVKSMNWKFEPNLLIKNKNTKHQVGLRGDDRRKNLSGVFAVNPSHIQNTTYNILIFDDVYTTGSTIKEATKVLESEGFKDVWSLTVAR